MSRLSRRSLAAPTARYLTPRKASGIKATIIKALKITADNTAALAQQGHVIEHFKSTGSIQPLKDWYKDPAVSDTPYLATAIDVIQHAYALPRTKNWGALQTALANAVSRVALNNADPAQSLAAAQDEYNKAVGK